MKDLLFIIFVLLAYFVSAIVHEYDLARNFNKTGDAKAWFNEIKEK